MAQLFVVCPECQCKLEVLEAWRGMEVSCPDCHAKINVPQADAEDGDLLIGVRKDDDAGNSSSAVPPCLQESSAAAERKKVRRRKGAVNVFIKIFFSLILLALLAIGGWFGMKKYFYFRSGFHDLRTVDGVIIQTSGHGFYLEAVKVGQPYSGKVSTEVSGGRWMSVEFVGGKAHGELIIYDSGSGGDDVSRKLYFEHGRLRRISDANGKSFAVKYDFFDRPSELVIVDAENENQHWQCSYSYAGIPEKLTAVDGQNYAECSFNASLFPHEVYIKSDGADRGYVKFEYDAEKKLKNVDRFDNKGKKIKSYAVEDCPRGIGPLHTLLKER